jgi:hypothetical protein
MAKFKLINRVVLYLILIIVLVVLYFVPDQVLFENKDSLCLHKIILGIECPLCGMTRAAHELMHFRFLSAFQYNFTIYLLSLFIIVDFTDYVFPGRNLRLLRKISLISLLSGFAIIYILRLGFYFGLI